MQPPAPAAGAELPALGHSCPRCSRHCHTSPQRVTVRGSAAPGKPANVCPSVRPCMCLCLLTATEGLGTAGSPGHGCPAAPAALQPQLCCVGEHGQCCSHFPAATSRWLGLRSGFDVIASDEPGPRIVGVLSFLNTHCKVPLHE